MKLPIARPTTRPAATPAALARPVVARPTLARPSVAQPVAKTTAAKGKIPQEIQQLALKAEENNRLKNKANASYEAQRKALTTWMTANKVKVFTATGEVDGEERNVVVSLEDTSRARLDLTKLLQVTGLTLEELYEQDILSTTAKAVSDKLGATFASDATVPGTPNIQAKITAV